MFKAEPAQSVKIGTLYQLLMQWRVASNEAEQSDDILALMQSPIFAHIQNNIVAYQAYLLYVLQGNGYAPEICEILAYMVDAQPYADEVLDTENPIQQVAQSWRTWLAENDIADHLLQLTPVDLKAMA